MKRTLNNSETESLKTLILGCGFSVSQICQASGATPTATTIRGWLVNNKSPRRKSAQQIIAAIERLKTRLYNK